ncbi:hypothetical protein [Burkholderia vietnamiensis]|uniref:hypothetical protein n=1 Tax=Burkholderia vietnamiensis TaxID=60552 RepID=UPI000AEE4006|nr:hypothetical protein [Burkholderia vietnamiensis]MBR8189182.1 hypothetical protein [Burkholderia vietnamiensis]HDR9174389.1 hypothetical protein [Burkholderia vietnamiensis]
MPGTQRSRNLQDLDGLARATFEALGAYGIAGIWACLALDHLQQLSFRDTPAQSASLKKIESLASQWQGASNPDHHCALEIFHTLDQYPLDQLPNQCHLELAATAIVHALQTEGFAGIKAVLALDRLGRLRLTAEHEFETRALYSAVAAFWNIHPQASAVDALSATRAIHPSAT